MRQIGHTCVLSYVVIVLYTYNAKTMPETLLIIVIPIFRVVRKWKAFGDYS